MRLTISAFLVSLCVLAPSSFNTAAAQERATPPPVTVDRTDVDFDPGWLGLLGLIGLAGLAGRNRLHTKDTVVREEVAARR